MNLYTHTQTYIHTQARTHARMQTNSMAKSPYSESSSSSDNELRVSRTPTVNYRDDRSPSLLPTLTASGAELSSFFKIHFNIIHPPTPKFSKQSNTHTHTHTHNGTRT